MCREQGFSDLLELLAGRLRVVGIRPSQVPRVQFEHGVLVVSGVEIVFELTAEHQRVHLGPERHAVLGYVEEIMLAACVGVREHERVDVLGVVQGVCEGEHPAPGLTVECHDAEVECRPDRLHFLNEPGDLPEGRVVRPVGVAAAELVVEDELPVVSGYLAEAIEVAAAYTRAAVQAKQGAACGAEDAVRDLVPAFYFDAALTRERCGVAPFLSGRRGHSRQLLSVLARR